MIHVEMIQNHDKGEQIQVYGSVAYRNRKG